MVWEGGRLPPDPHPSLQGLGSVYGGLFLGHNRVACHPSRLISFLKVFIPDLGLWWGWGCI